VGARDVDVLVIGAGAAGLAAAATLRAAGREPRVLDAGDRPGGVMRSDAVEGHLFERGPNTLQTKASAQGFLARQGLVSGLVAAAPASRLRFLFHGGRLEPVPMGPIAFARSPLLSARGKLRLLAEPFVRGGDPSGESVAEFMARRFGSEVAERLVAPALTGIYAGDERQLGAEAVLGFLTDLERAGGGVVRGALGRLVRGGGAAKPEGETAGPKLRGSYSTERGLGALAERLARPLGEALSLGTRVTALRREGGDFVAECAREGGGAEASLRARRVVLATPAPAAAVLLAGLEPEAAAALHTIAYVPIASVSVSVDPGAARTPIEGFGFLVPRASGLRLLGCLFMSRLFDGRAPAGRALLTCILGGARWPEAVEEPDDTLARLLGDELARTLGLRDEPRVLGVTRWRHAVAQPGRRHGALVADVRRRLASAAPGLALAGSYLDGVSLADTMACGERAAQGLLAAP
jgi:oxygen-dependent protoporphyrinogen oxidase